MLPSEMDSQKLDPQIHNPNNPAPSPVPTKSKETRDSGAGRETVKLLMYSRDASMRA